MKTLIKKFAFFIIIISFLGIIACGSESSTDDGNGNGNNGNGDNDNIPEAVSTQELRAFQLVNEERVSEGLAELTRNSDIDAVARAHSEDMRDRGFFSHTNPDGEDPSDRLNEAGISWTACAENIGSNQGYDDPAAAAVEGWMDSAGHRANILDESGHGYTHTGMGVAIDSDTSPSTYYLTQVFVK